MKKFTIITPCYNGAEYIRTCIEAIANTNYDLSLIQHIVVDDGSTDKTKEICTELAKKYSHVKFINKENGNWGSVINYVKNNKLASGDYVYICDADDYVLPNIFTAVNELCTDEDLFCIGFYRKHVKCKFRIHPYMRLFVRKFKNNKSTKYYSPIICPQSAFVKTEIFNNLPDLKEKVSYQDTILFANILERADTIKYTKKPLMVYWYKRPGNSMSQFNNEAGFKKWIDNFNECSNHDWINPVVAYLISNKALRKYLKQNCIKFRFNRKHLDMKFIPAICRPAYRLLYLIMVKKFIEK